ncbi:hypothetical protein ABENE_13655 [Asticcacaulis benevestitus DSM 16100 = ATCC BAA-896]|uniref:Uncharacterized protein n=1 Tax=Asticcacaulis benevestitus DSM 16100 = ATCC BAA-896 TaxID=1121022 RepID=V4REH3_9CAUL|nr:hypothetical protein ABENE_13655 [Asticcacaulis benevestitus DSM 16100 = ATCC BAA-896]
MKVGIENVVPLSRQSKAILLAIRVITGEEKYEFPSIRTGERPMSENAINVAIRLLGYRSWKRPGLSVDNLILKANPGLADMQH